MAFETLDIAIEFLTALRRLLELVRQHDRDLAGQLQRAATSVAMCLGEGRERVGRDRPHLFRIAAGSAAEVDTGLRVALAWGFVTEGDVAQARALLDRVRAMIYRLLHRR